MVKGKRGQVEEYLPGWVVWAVILAILFFAIGWVLFPKGTSAVTLIKHLFGWN